ncbi:MAG: tetratricopeptide repeat protein, partial [Leptolyngbyaceae bacterium]|nr:tetratricopeptide repeat protein [Leptolyngbyaceae bacterium]
YPAGGWAPEGGRTMDFRVHTDVITDLNPKDFPKIGFTTAGQLALERGGKIASLENPVRKLTFEQQAHLKAAYYWLKRYQPEVDDSPLAQVRGYIDGCFHLAEMGAMQEAEELLFVYPPVDQVAKTASPLHQQLGEWGYHQEQVDLYERFIDTALPQRQGLYLNGVGQAYRYLGQFDAALARHQRAQQMAQERGDRLAEAQAWGGLGRVQWYMGYMKESRDSHQRQLTLAGGYFPVKPRWPGFWLGQPLTPIFSTEQQIEQCRAYTGIGVAYSTTDKSRALKPLEMALAMAITLENEQLRSEILKGLADTYTFMGDLATGMDYAQQYSDLAIRCRNLYHQHTAMHTQACIQICWRQYGEAIALGEKALDMAKPLGHRVAQARTSNTLGIAYCYGLKQYDQAMMYFKRSGQLSEVMGDLFTGCLVQAHLANCYIFLGEMDMAADYCERARSAAAKVEHPIPKAVVLAALANVHWSQGEVLPCLWLLLRSFVILPPWKSANGRLIWQKAIEVIGGGVGKALITMTRKSKYFRK